VLEEFDPYAELTTAHRDLALWRNLVALLPWTVHVDHEHERARERARRLARIPTQRGVAPARRLTTPRGHL
jgi:hypothetical protein